MPAFSLLHRALLEKAAGKPKVVEQSSSGKRRVKMGAAHSRARPGAGPAKFSRPSHKVVNNEAFSESNYGYFILCIKGGDRIKLVNASGPVLKMLTSVVKRHFVIIKAGWDRQMAYSFKIQKASRDSLISMTAEALLTLYRLGWMPMTPIDLSVSKKKGQSSQNQTAICFRRDSSEPEADADETPTASLYRNAPAPRLGSAGYNASIVGESFDECMLNEHKECLCIETYGDNILGFHDVPNIMLYDLVRCVQQEWAPGIRGISNAVSSVISDYAVDMDFAVLPGDVIGDRRFLKLHGLPWSKADEGADLFVRAHRHDLGARARQETLVGIVEIVKPHAGLDHADPRLRLGGGRKPGHRIAIRIGE